MNLGFILSLWANMPDKMLQESAFVPKNEQNNQENN